MTDINTERTSDTDEQKRITDTRMSDRLKNKDKQKE